jgi:methylmalonyl-CoA epimerase
VSTGTGIRHLAVIVRSLAAAEDLYARRLGLAVSRREVLSHEAVRVSFVPAGTCSIELLEPIGHQGALGRFMDAHGPGIHHIALEVRDLAAALARARQAGLRVIEPAPRPGAGGTRVAFIHPSGTHGVLVELVDHPGPDLH